MSIAALPNDPAMLGLVIIFAVIWTLPSTLDALRKLIETWRRR
ncbi:hypothetical protein [Muricoccus nepalensis]|nr:hypothetical protein [Roseomonas nepalensis]